MTLSRAHRSWAVLTENRGKERATGRCSSLNRRAKSGGTGALDTQRQRGHVEVGGVTRGRSWKPVEAGRRRELPACTVQVNYRIATRFISQITLKFVWKLKNLEK